MWTAATPVRFAGTWFPHVMAVIRLSGGDLVLHSPCRPSDELRAGIAALGNVGHIIAPNWFHDLYLSQYRELYPNAVLWGPHRLRRCVDRDIDGDIAPPWGEELSHLTLRGLLTFDESIFFHRVSRTLIVADVLMNAKAGADSPLLTRLGLGLFGLDGSVKVFPVLRWSGTGRRQLKAAAEQISQWKPERLIVGHGTPVKQMSADEMQKALLC